MSGAGRLEADNQGGVGMGQRKSRNYGDVAFRMYDLTRESLS